MSPKDRPGNHVAVPARTAAGATDRDTDQESSPADFYIVGIGASAGGLEALEQMFHAMPHDSGMAFVIVQHLSPDFRSLMDELLARHTKMAIHRVEDGMVVRPDSLYLIPPKQDMIISSGRLLLTEKDETRSLSLPIDHFLRSLAQDAGRRSIAIVLSGTGSDGSRGLRDVHEAGGLVIAQSIDSAKFDGMPKSAIDTGLVDIVVAPPAIPDVLQRYAAHPIRSQLTVPPLDESSIEHVFRLLQERHRIDFNYYKPTTIGRRIERRIQLNHHGNIDEYVRRLESDPDEVDQLYKDLLIGVTRFFRDRDAFGALQHDILPQLLLEHKADEEFRVWVAGCGTGEEAYSVAIAIRECLRSMNRKLNVKIFATDVHQASLDVAHSGVYPNASLEDCDEGLISRWFTKTDSGWQVSPDIRQMIVFAPHNLVKDAPFTRLDLVTCRNLLIYLRSMAQKKVFSLFHFGLKTRGVLFLGASESPGELADEFETLNERWRLYRKRRDIRLPPDMRGTLEVSTAGWHVPAGAATTGVMVRTGSELAQTYDELLERYMPPGILVNERREIVHIFGGAGRYLSIADGRLTPNVMEMASGDLRLALAGGLQRASKSGEPVSYSRVKAEVPGGEVFVRVEVCPLRRRGTQAVYLLTFEETVTPTIAASGEAASGEVSAIASESLDLSEVSRSQLEDTQQELRYTRENLQATIEELETSNEELQATNEEMVASNEELQSTNEELHSVNEELYTVNAEYQKKIAELTELTLDMDNLLVSTEVHTLFLDAGLCIRKFTPRMADAFNLVPHDIGRRIDAFSHNIQCRNLAAAVTDVLTTGERYEESVQDGHGQHFLMRILPYRAADRTSGVVLTLIDVSSLVAAQNSVKYEQDRFERAMAANRDGTWDWTIVGSDEMWWSPNCYTLLGYAPGEFPARYSEWLKRVHPDDLRRLKRTSVPGSDRCYVELHAEFEYRMRHKSGEYRWFCHRAIVDHGPDGRVVRMTGSIADIHERQLSKEKSAQEIRRRDEFLAMLSHEFRNPLGALLNAVAYAKHDHSESLAADGAAAIAVVERQARHMTRLLDDLLDVARLGRGKIEFRSEVVDLTVLAKEVLEAVYHETDRRGQNLQAQIPDEPLPVIGDPARIRQAQVNLLTNASKYTPDGGLIVYSINREGTEAVISVRDTGAGIPADQLTSIFDLFVQSDTSLARPSGGLGVGLSLAKSIIEAHGGRIYAESSGPGQGSNFVIRLSLTDRRVTESPPEDAEHSPRDACPGLRLLLVEDNQDARNMLEKMLQRHGFEVVSAADGRSGLELFQSFRPNVAIVDIGLPVIDGFQVAREVRKDPALRSTRLIALTGYGRESDRREALDAGFDAHLIKPLNPDTLLSLISATSPK